MNRNSTLLKLALTAALLHASPLAQAQQHAHSHGRLAMNVSVDAQTIGIQLEVPLDNFLGFERAPRNDAERKSVGDMVARLQAADKLFLIDPRAGCALSKVLLTSQVLGLSTDNPASQAPTPPAAAGNKRPADEHAEIEVSITFVCPNPELARHIDIKLFDAFKGTRTIDAQVASGQGQFKRRLNRTTTRLAWGK